MKTTDGGITWTTINSGTAVDDISQIKFIDLNTGYISGLNGYLAKTVDGGQSWTPLNTGTTFIGTSNLLGLHFVNNNIGFASGGNLQENQSYILKTTDGGITWIRLSPPNNGVTYSAIQFLNSEVGYAVGGYATSSSGYIIKTIDGGNTWSVVNSPTMGRPFGFLLINAGLGFAVGTNTLIIKGN